VALQGGQPSTVDLHQAQVVTAIAIAIDRMRSATGFLQGNGFEQVGGYAVALGRLLKTWSRTGKARKKPNKYKNPEQITQDWQI